MTVQELIEHALGAELDDQQTDDLGDRLRPLGVALFDLVTVRTPAGRNYWTGLPTPSRVVLGDDDTRTVAEIVGSVSHGR